MMCTYDTKRISISHSINHASNKICNLPLYSTESAITLPHFNSLSLSLSPSNDFVHSQWTKVAFAIVITCCPVHFINIFLFRLHFLMNFSWHLLSQWRKDSAAARETSTHFFATVTVTFAAVNSFSHVQVSLASLLLIYLHLTHSVRRAFVTIQSRHRHSAGVSVYRFN